MHLPNRSLFCVTLGAFILLTGLACTDDPGTTSVAANSANGDNTNIDAGNADDINANGSQSDADTGDIWTPPPDGELSIGPDDRPAKVLVPDDYDGTQALPAIFLFHGYTETSESVDEYLDMSAQRHGRQFILVLADGHEDPTGQQFWNATDFCCDHYDAEPDDVGYFQALYDDLFAQLNVDAARVHLMGHSNGHFFANRLACDMGSKIASVVGLSGGGHWEADDCPGDGQISSLHIHGTADAVIQYLGLWGLYPGAQTMASRWAERNDCGSESSLGDNISVSSIIFGKETVRRRYDDCPEGIDVELWTVTGGSHIPALESDFTDRILDFALSQTNQDAPDPG